MTGVTFMDTAGLEFLETLCDYGHRCAEQLQQLQEEVDQLSNTEEVRTLAHGGGTNTSLIRSAAGA